MLYQVIWVIMKNEVGIEFDRRVQFYHWLVGEGFSVQVACGQRPEIVRGEATHPMANDQWGPGVGAYSVHKEADVARTKRTRWKVVGDEVGEVVGRCGGALQTT